MKELYKIECNEYIKQSEVDVGLICIKIDPHFPLTLKLQWQFSKIISNILSTFPAILN